MVAVSLTQGQRQGQARLPFQLPFFQAVLGGPGFEEVGDVANLGEEKRQSGLGWGRTGTQVREVGNGTLGREWR